MTIKKIVREKQGTLIDVRTPEEFKGDNVAGSINIPLQEIPERINELKALREPLILFCASGNRSGQAEHYLKQLGIECHNGGSWLDIRHYKSQTL